MALFGLWTNAHAQLSGTLTIPGSYPTFMAAVADLNTQGVGPGGVIFNIAGGYTETGVAAVLTVATNPPSATRPVVFRKNGAGVNPLLTAGVGTSIATDGIVKLNGVDYVTFDGIDLQENPANANNTTRMEWGYSLVKVSATNGCHNNTIQNCTVTLDKANTNSVGIYLGNHIATATTALTVTSFLGTSSNNKFYNNTVQNSFQGITLTGFASPAPFDLYDKGNEIGVDGVSANPNRVLDFGGGATGTANGIACAGQNNLKIFNTQIDNTVGTATATTLNGIVTSASTNASVDIYNNTLTLASAATTSTLFAINNGAGGTGAGNTINIYGNTVTGCTYPTATSGEFRGINQTATATYTNIYNNTISNNSQAGTGNFNCIHYSGASATLVLAVNIYGNTVSGNTKSGTGGNFNCIFASASTFTTNCYNNLLFNNSAAATNAAVAGYHNFGFGLNEYVYNNQFYNNVGGTGTTIGFDVRSGSGPTDKQVYGNVVRDISCSGTISGILLDYGTNCNIYNNNVYNLSTSATVGTAGTPHAIGINVGGVSAVQNFVNTYNNFISDIRAPAITTSPAVVGIATTGSAASNLSVWHNTIYLNATTTSATTFSTAGILMGSTPVSINMSNNIVVNTSATGPTGGLAAAIQRIGVSLNSYGLSAGHNCLYAGVPSANRVIFTDGTNSDQTIQAFKNRVGPREQASFSELPPFINSVIAPFDLHLQTTLPTQCDSGGKAVATVGDDFDGNTRNTTFPDVGADEFNGISTDIASPDIQYTLLSNGGVAANRSVPAWATITDPSGVNVTAGTRPRLYYKKSTHANTYVDNTNATDGWKFVEASNAASPFAFTIDYTLLFGGGSVVAGDIIQYFVTAQDLNTTPRIGLNNGGFTTQPASVALAAANFPLTNTINQYTIVANTYSGVIPVGPAETVNSLTNAGGAFALLNAGVLSGNVTLSITGDLTAETGTHPLNQWAEQGAGNYTVTIAPSAGVTRLISGSNTTLSLIRFDGADRAIMDGRFGGTGRFLTIRNTSNVTPTVGYINDAQGDTLRNCIIESGNSSTSGASGGAVLIGGTTLLQGNDNNTITANEIRDRSDVVGTPSIGINCVGNSAGSPNAFNSGCTISDNDIHDWYLANGTFQFGIFVSTGNTGFSITGNSLYQTAARAHSAASAITRGINVSNAFPSTAFGGFNISGNFIGGSAPGANGSDWTLTSTSTHTFTGIFLATGLNPSTVQNNTVRRINYTTIAPSANTTMFVGISAGQGNINIANNTVGAATGTGSISVNVNTGGTSSSFVAGVFSATVNGVNTITDNTVGGWNFGGTVTAAALIPQYIQYQGTPTGNFSITNNVIGSTTTANSIQNNLATAPSLAFGIRLLITTGALGTISGNTIQNINDLSTATTSASYGMLLVNTIGATAPLTVTNNTVQDITAHPLATSSSINVIGIAIQGYHGSGHTFNGNRISSIHNLNPSSGLGLTVGLHIQSVGGEFSQMNIHDINNANTGLGSGVIGILVGSNAKDLTISNGMIALDCKGQPGGAGANQQLVVGIKDDSDQKVDLIYNSICICDQATTSSENSYAYYRSRGSLPLFRNNLFHNARTSGTVSHFSIGSSGPIGKLDASYNLYIAEDMSKIFEVQGSGLPFHTWKSSLGQDLESYSDISSKVPPATFFVNPAAGDLNINIHSNLCWYVNGKGIAGIASNNIPKDKGGGPRGTYLGIPTDIGADEFDPYDITVDPIDCEVQGTPGSGSTTIYLWAGRRVAEINWGQSGNFPNQDDYPSCIGFKYWSGLMPPVPPLPGNSCRTVSSCWDIAVGGKNILGNIVPYPCDYGLKIYYVLAEQNQIPDPDLEWRQKDSNQPSWNYYPPTVPPTHNQNFGPYTEKHNRYFPLQGVSGQTSSSTCTSATWALSHYTLGECHIPLNVACVNDTLMPDASCRSVNVPLDQNGNGTLLAIAVNNGSTDNCGIANLFLSQTAFTCANIGFNPVVLSVVDSAGNTDTCMAAITVSDTVAPIAICQTTTVYLDALGVGNTTASAVDAGSFDACGIASLVLSQTSFTCANVGPNTGTLTVTDVNGNTGTCSTIITVLDTIAPVAACQNTSVYLDASGAGITSASAVDAGSSDACGITSLVLSQTNFYIIDWGPNVETLTVTDVNGNVSTCTTTITVLDTIAPVALCQPVTIQLDPFGNGSTTASVIDNGSFDAGGISSLSLSQTAFTCAQLGPNTVTLTATDASGNNGTCTATVTVIPSPVAGTITANATACGYHVTCPAAADGIATAIGSGGCSGYTYLWSSGDTTTTATGLSAGTYTVTISDSTGGAYVSSVTLTEPTIIQLAATLTPAGCPTVSTGAIDLTVTGGNACQGYTYLWSNGATTQDLTNLSSGIYAVTVTDVNGCTRTNTFFVPASPAITANFFASPNNLTYTFNDNSTGSPIAWSWDFGDGSTSTLQNPTHTYSADGSYSVCLIASDSVCSDTLCLLVSVVGMQNPNAPFQLTVWPNPTQDLLAIEVGLPIGVQVLQLRLVDMAGRVLRSPSVVEPGTQQRLDLDLSDLPAGVYILEAEADGVVARRRIVVL